MFATACGGAELWLQRVHLTNVREVNDVARELFRLVVDVASGCRIAVPPYCLEVLPWQAASLFQVPRALCGRAGGPWRSRNSSQGALSCARSPVERAGRTGRAVM